MKAKYVIFKDHTGLELAMVFSPIFNHSDFKHVGEVVSAGQCFITRDYNEAKENSDDEVRVQCFGESITLKVKSRGEIDAKCIKLNFRD